MFKIGTVSIKNKVVMAPIAGASNPAYMKICEEMGVGYAITELISSEAIIRENKKTFDMLNGIEKLNIPYAIQLFGSDEKHMAKAAKIIEKKYNPTVIDINSGCPVPKIATKTESGSGLLKDPDKLYKIVSEVVKSVKVPVTVKIRSGWDLNSINAIEIAKAIEKAGASAITIHPRTRSQGYSGKADWNIIKEVKENVSIPVIGNGDIRSPLDAKRMLDETKCDAVMIGRAILGSPWIIRDTVKYLEDGTILDKPTNKEKINMAKKHLNYLIETKNEQIAIKEMRMHIRYYLKGMNKSSEIKSKLFKVTKKEDFVKILDDYLETLT